MIRAKLTIEGCPEINGDYYFEGESALQTLLKIIEKSEELGNQVLVPESGITDSIAVPMRSYRFRDTTKSDKLTNT